MAAKPMAEAKQNLTIQLSKAAITKAKVAAARRGLSVSRLVAELLEKLDERDADYEAAKRRALALMEQGFDLGGGPYYRSRDELHER